MSSRPNKELPSPPPNATASSRAPPRKVAPSPPPQRPAPTPVTRSNSTIAEDEKKKSAAVVAQPAKKAAGLTRTVTPRKFPDKPPPAPPKAPPTNLAVGKGRNIRSSDRRRSVMLQKKVMPALRPARPVAPARGPLPPPPSSKAVVPDVERCPSCGAHSTDAFCGECGTPMPGAAAVQMDGGLDALLEDAKLKVCVECTEEGFDAFCAKCGGKMVLIADDDDDDDFDLDLPPPTASTTSATIAGANDAMARLEAALMQGVSSTPTKVAEVPAPKPVAVKVPTVTVQSVARAPAPSPAPARAPAPSPAAAAPVHSSGPLFALPKVPRERVFVIDLGSDSVKYGWNTDAEASRIRACVDGRANANTGGFTVKGQVYPMDSSVGDMEDKLFSDQNIYLDDLCQKICKVGNYSADNHALLICTSVPNHFECVSDWIYRWMEGEVIAKKPRMLYCGYTPMFALMAALNTPSPTGIIVDVGAISTSVVPIYAGCKLDHAIQTQMFGGRLIAEIVGSKAVLSARDENALANAIKAACFVAVDFKQEMAKNGYGPANVAMGQVWRGWKSTSTSAEKFVETGPVRMGVERFCVPELFFSPTYHTQTTNMASLPALVQACVAYCPKQMHGVLLQNIYIHGEGSRFPGFTERLQAELGAIFRGTTVRVAHCVPNAGWQGAKRFSCMDSFTLHCTNEADIIRFSKISHRFF